ncbi:hypothetical protein Rsub_06551 [Raphidocelis subcapitata]|uniref:Uncharacterized protein n=1 Tax=Raphidocelis subcapitata TaxID=307507 RepID=A0A2V0P329_9CHLO|nr:hypothetical protein Rsub_06551 [Raphidocelis subcapitata]|eukprot:GBF94281.1 hypothetical protein Rsub_06551 [Raphidocelis subcapitata]
MVAADPSVSDSWERAPRQDRTQPLPPPAAPASRIPVALSPFLMLTPANVETEYWRCLQTFDLANCLIPLVYFGKLLTAAYTRTLLVVYGGVLALKLLHLLLLLAAPEACLSWRRSLIWTERVVRTLVSARVVAAQQQSKPWDERLPLQAQLLRALVINSGLTISCWNIFCLPLGFPSQVILTSAFVLSTLPASLGEVSRALAGPLAAAPWLAAARTRLLSALRASGALALSALAHGTLAAPPAAAPEAAAPGDEPDVTSLAAVLACGYILFACGAVPLWLAYHMERVHKHRWLATNPSLLWVNPPPPGGEGVGRWPRARRAAAQLGPLLAAALAASEACVAMWSWLGLAVWA